MNARTECRASFTVEAALVFPLAAVALAILAGIAKCCAGWFLLRATAYDAADRLADYSYLYEMADLDQLSAAAGEQTDLTELDLWLKARGYEALVDQLGCALAKSFMTKDLADTDLSSWGVADGIGGISLWGTKVFYAQQGHEGLIRLMVSYKPEFFGTEGLFEAAPVRLRTVTHAFWGDGGPESAGDSEPKVYRIGDGEKFHTLDCYIIDKNVTELSLSEALAQGYEPCSQCKGWESGTVYVSKGGECFHTKHCSHLYPELAEMTLSEARELGLEPCKLCVGKEEWFTGNE